MLRKNLRPPVGIADGLVLLSPNKISSCKVGAAKLLPYLGASLILIIRLTASGNNRNGLSPRCFLQPGLPQRLVPRVCRRRWPRVRMTKVRGIAESQITVALLADMELTSAKYSLGRQMGDSAKTRPVRVSWARDRGREAGKNMHRAAAIRQTDGT